MIPPSIGLFGGTFDPIHYGHLRLAEYLLQYFQWTEIRFIPTPASPLRPQPQASFQDRIALLALALRPFPTFMIDPLENDLPAPIYTINTLRELRAQYEPDTSLAFIIGQDAWNTLHLWQSWEQLREYAHLVVVNRPDVPDQAAPVVQETFAPYQQTDPLYLHNAPSGFIFQVTCPPNPISATAIRHAIQTQNDALLQQAIPSELIEYIKQHRLYLNCI
ncbi:MAG: nicotinate (nicotinamide) nucleotide adenylyltransferase [Gammaproteobacteria bacterium RIFCSPHIGHO2_12_FULL_45_9]|nr:MAG: nicotinate (nicotinamide) nucleotide adenylyltransferase [Gammaproteobacteria bacterium RIFCSPHIGHO2_12_FULL_45_9]